METQELIKTFVDIAKEHEDCEDILEELRGLASFGEVSQDEYNYIIQNWDNILREHGLLP